MMSVLSVSWPRVTGAGAVGVPLVIVVGELTGIELAALFVTVVGIGAAFGYLTDRVDDPGLEAAWAAAFTTVGVLFVVPAIAVLAGVTGGEFVAEVLLGGGLLALIGAPFLAMLGWIGSIVGGQFRKRVS